MKSHVFFIEFDSKFVAQGFIDDKSALLRAMAWHSNKPLFEPITTSFINAQMRHSASVG